VEKETEIVRDVSESLVNVCTREDHFLGPLSKAYQAAEKERNKGSMKVSKNNCQTLYAMMDVEGVDPNLAEIAVILSTTEEIVGVKLFHLRIADSRVLLQGTRYCHGIDPRVLREIATHSQKEALKEIKEWLEGQASIVVYTVSKF
jgi:hypothetical protein